MISSRVAKRSCWPCSVLIELLAHVLEASPAGYEVMT
jgi:hypothetical protein